MATVTVIADDLRTVAAEIAGDRVLVAPGDLPAAIGWTLKAEGLCRDDVCVPVRDRSGLETDGRIDLAAAATALGRQVIVDTTGDPAYVALALPAEQRRRALHDLEVPDLELPDLDGAPQSLHQWRGRKVLLQAFSSW